MRSSQAPGHVDPPSRVPRTDALVKDLVDAAVAGDRDAFGALYDFFASDLYRYFLSHVGNVHDAEDLVSRTFVRAWRAVPRFRWRGRPFEAWLFTLAKNQLVDYFRERRSLPGPLDPSHPEQRPGPEPLALFRAEAEATRRALLKLTFEQRQVVILKFYLERDNREIAQIMGKREGTVRALQMRALQAMRRHLRDV